MIVTQTYSRTEELEKFARKVGVEMWNVPDDLLAGLEDAEETNKRLCLEDIYDDAVSEALGYCNRETVVPGMATSIRDLAKIRYNQEGAEGELSRSEGGVSQTFEDGIPRKIRSQLNRYRIAKVGWM